MSAITPIATAELPELAAKIADAVHQANTHACAAVQHALVAGRLLTDAKAQVPHGAWESWVFAHCDVAPRTARAFMRLAEKWPTIQNGNGAANLSLREAFKAIATPPTAAPRSTPINYPRRDQRERAVLALKKAADAQRDLARNISMNYVQRRDIERARKKLQAALAALDELQATDTTLPAAEVAA